MEMVQIVFLYQHWLL